MITHDIVSGVLIAFFWSVMVSMTIIIAYNVIPVIERNFFPVIDVNTFSLTYVATLPDDMVLLNMSFEKKRERCAPIPEKFVWYKMNRYGYLDRAYYITPRDPGGENNIANRPTGLNRSLGWKVNLGGYAGYRKEQKIVFYHKCNPLWETRTEIVIPDAKNR
jgi:hypothetical protein